MRQISNGMCMDCCEFVEFCKCHERVCEYCNLDLDYCECEIEEFIPIGWENVRLTDNERDALCQAVDRNDQDEAETIVDGAYNRLFGESIN